MRRSDRAGSEVVRGRRATERQLHVRVRIDAAGNDEPIRRVDRHVSFHVQLRADNRNSFAFDQKVGFVIVGCGYDLAVTD